MTHTTLPCYLVPSTLYHKIRKEGYNKMELNSCPKCDSRLWGVERYSAPKKLFYLICSDCQHTEVKEWVYQNPIQMKK